MKASRIIAACVVLHNWAIAFRTPLLVDDHPDDGDDAGCTGTNLPAHAVARQPSVTGKAARDALVERYFNRFA